MTKEITNSDNIIDSRDVIARIEELVAGRPIEWEETDTGMIGRHDGLSQEVVIHQHDDPPGSFLLEFDGEINAEDGTQVVYLTLEEAQGDAESLSCIFFNSEEEKEELASLEALASEGEDATSDWKHGATLIVDHYFQNYAEEFVKDIGDMPSKIPSYIVVDWAATAENIQQDYTAVDFDGETYWVR